MSTTNGDLNTLKVTDRQGNDYVLSPVDAQARQDIEDAKNLQFDDNYFEVDETDDEVTIGLSSTAFGVDTDTPLVVDDSSGFVLKSTAPFATAIAPDYNPQSTYAEGVRCMYKGKLYRCTTAIQTAEAWTTAHWTEENVISFYPMVVQISSTNNVWNIDKTFTEIKTAYDAGTQVIVLFEGGSSDNIFVGQIDRVYETTNNHWKIDFQQVSYPDDLSGHRTITIMKAFLDDENTLTVNAYEHVIMPDALHQSSVADEYSASSTYTANSLVTHNGRLYTNPNAISTAEDWTAAHWTQTTVEELVDAANKFEIFEVQDSGGSAVFPTYAQITAALADGKIPVLKRTNLGNGNTYFYICSLIDETNHAVWFRGLQDSNLLVVDSNDGWADPCDIAKTGSVALDYTALTFPVSEGAYCMHDGYLYYCSVAGGISTSEPWTPAHWTGTNVTSIIGDVETLLAAL